MVPVEDCIATTGAMTGKGCGGVGSGGIGNRVWGAVKEGEGCKVTVHGEEFSEEIGGVDEAGKEDKTEELLAGPLPEPVETHVYRAYLKERTPIKKLKAKRKIAKTLRF